MLRGNLSSRPFYNERLVSAAIAVIAVLAAAVLAVNVYELSALSSQRSALKASIDRDAADAQRIERSAQDLQRRVDRATLVQLAGSTQEANVLIDERTFSWTVFFGLIEKTLPLDLRLVAVAPRVDKGNVRVTMTVVGRRPEDIDTFINALRETGAFYDLLARNTERNEDEGTYRGEVIAYYLAPGRSAGGPAGAGRTAATGRGRRP